MSTSTEHTTYMQRFRNEQRAKGVRRVSVTLTAAEYSRLMASAKGFKESPTTHLKRSALSGLSGEVRLDPDIQTRLEAFLSVVRGIGNNLNQLARHSNEMRAFMDTNEVRLQLRRMDEDMRSFLTEATRAARKDRPPSPWLLRA